MLRPICPILCLKYRAWFIYLYGMPFPKGYLHSIFPFTGTQPHPRPFKHIRLHTVSYNCSAVTHKRTATILIRLQVIEHHIQASLQANGCFRCFQMPMDRHNRPSFQRVQHPLRTILSTRSEVIVHALSLRCRSPQMQCCQQIVIDFYCFHIVCLFLQGSQICFMQMIILFHERHISYCQHQKRTDEIQPVSQQCVWHKEYKA